MSIFQDISNFTAFSLVIVVNLIIIVILVKFFNYIKQQYLNQDISYQSSIIPIFLGVISSIMSVFIQLPFGFEPTFRSIIIAPIVEETTKLLMIIYLSQREDFDNLYDGIIYGSIVGAGFGFSENLLYAFKYIYLESSAQNILWILLGQGFQFTFGHPIFSSIAGIGVAYRKVGLKKNNYNKLHKSIIFHLAWNVFATFRSFIGIIIVILIMLYSLRKEVKQIQSENPY